ncbi:MAG: hypothetical protein AAF560_32575, partial [Acidobacteriota bacterium]
LAGCAWVSARSRSWDAMLLGLVPIFALIVTSRYYASYLALVPLLGAVRGPPESRSRWIVASQLGVWAAFFGSRLLGSSAYEAYSLLNFLLILYFAVLLLLHGRRRVP